MKTRKRHLQIDLVKDTIILYDKLKKKYIPRTESHTQKKRKLYLVYLWQTQIGKKIIAIDASDIGYGGVLKQISLHNKQLYLVRFHSGKWSNSLKNYAPTAKEILAIVNCVLKFQDDLYNQQFNIITDC
uniref:Reverse transcriptase RNase H-like domain-containing protein n=1 Tax=Lactuca sativa TaxID=4236 RepID=A0A9R1VLI5_LACSA|nr:hypothetical protein LSAT_V11C500289680 [Lactuca sativa]